MPGRLLTAAGLREVDVVAFQVATMGGHVSAVSNQLFTRNAYREYLQLRGLSVRLAEAHVRCGTSGPRRAGLRRRGRP